MNVKPVISGSVELPFGLFGPKEAQELKRRLTFTVTSFEGDEKTDIATYYVNQDRGVVRVPFFFGLQQLQTFGVSLEECEQVISDGVAVSPPIKFPDPKHPMASPNQDEFFDDLLFAAKNQRTVLAVAPTGSGKTAAALFVAGKVGRATLVVVPSVEVANHWKDQAKLHLGYEDNDIGFLQGGKCHYDGKRIVVAVIHNIYMRRLSQRFKNYFGLVIWDEAHRLGAQRFNWTFGQFPARCRMGLTATLKRGAGAAIVENCFGKPSVSAQSDALPCQVRVVNFKLHMPEWRHLGKGMLISRLTKNQSRNRMIAVMVAKLYRSGRQLILLSDRIAHLQELMRLSEAEGVPSEAMGLFTRSYKGADGKPKVATSEELRVVREQASVIFASYGMGKESINIPRLDAGIDATPRADGIQAIGRIRRPSANKKMPVWFTIRDVGVPIFERVTESRLRDYKKSKSVEVIDYGKN